MASDTKTLVETAVRRFQEEVPALAQLKLVVGLDLRARHDVQMYRVELPGPVVSKDPAADARVRLSVTRSQFNALAEDGAIRYWRDAFARGDAKATGPEEILRLIRNVVEKQEERGRTRRPTQRAKH